jgi:Tfp pilus assembly protein PilF
MSPLCTGTSRARLLPICPGTSRTERHSERWIPKTKNQEAYQLFLKSRILLAQRSDVSLRQAIESFQKAVAVDPSYSEVWASLALAYSIASGYLQPEELKKLSIGRAEAEKAIKLDSMLSDAHVALANVNSTAFHWTDAEREFKLAIESNPNNAIAHYLYANSFLMPYKRFDQARSRVPQSSRNRSSLHDHQHQLWPWTGDCATF